MDDRRARPVDVTTSRLSDAKLRLLAEWALAAAPAEGIIIIPAGETNRWWIEDEETVEGFEGTVATCERYEVSRFIAEASPAVVHELVVELLELRERVEEHRQTAMERSER